MKLIVAFAVLVPMLAAAQQGPLTPDGRPDFQGVYRYDTMTPVERPPEFVNRAALTQAKAEAFALRRRAELARGPSAGFPHCYRRLNNGLPPMRRDAVCLQQTTPKAVRCPNVA